MASFYEPPRADYRIDGYKAATGQTEDAFFSVTLSADMLVPLAKHHSADGRDTYLLLYDRTAIWDIPGPAEYVTLHITRDTAQRTFDFAHERHPVIPLAQNWLIHQGCPAEAAELSKNHGQRPADALTARLEDMLRANPDDRYTVLDHSTDNPCSFDFGIEVSTLVHDSHPTSAHAPYRVFLEETTKDFRSYTMRAGAFPSVEAADTWVRERSAPLPLAPAPDGVIGLRAEAARARSTVNSGGLAVPPAAVIPPRSPSAAPARVRRSAP
ncbi:hypothetical protein [Streptomyces natalensis]|uniref:Glycosyl hydrolase n=1 Tax=Streptomyces natalensis ATCC 27448 TaxID=1240678 RepID=A0A0D7CP90_9ACTN|nr:hypothetical protein [Streptomyces natalensis]KIZ18038.1 hypothetical protein SNA_10215 [Streptomyces natalensis ATCC 27448]